MAKHDAVKDEALRSSFDSAFASLRGGKPADAVLHSHLARLRSDPEAFSIDWYGAKLGISGYGAVFIQHEALHHGQWTAHTALGGFPTPTGWIVNWGLYT